MYKTTRRPSNQIDNVAIAETKEGRKAHYLLYAPLALIIIRKKMPFSSQFFHVFHGFNNVQCSCRIFHQNRESVSSIRYRFHQMSVIIHRSLMESLHTINSCRYFNESIFYSPFYRFNLHQFVSKLGKMSLTAFKIMLLLKLLRNRLSWTKFIDF